MSIDLNVVRQLTQLTSRSNTYPEQMQALASIVRLIKPQKYLEIGAFEGRSAFLYTSLMACFFEGLPVHVTSVDSWQGGDEHKQAHLDMGSVQSTFDRVIHACQAVLPVESRFEKVKALSTDGLRSLADRTGYYDLILIDAGHRSKEVLVDLVYAWPLLREGGVVVLDDYTWIPKHENTCFQLNSPKMGIDAFCQCFADELTILSQFPLLQLYLQKRAPLDGSQHYCAFEVSEIPSIFKGVGLID